MPLEKYTTTAREINIARETVIRHGWMKQGSASWASETEIMKRYVGPEHDINSMTRLAVSLWVSG